MEKIRKRIDKVDQKIMSLISERLRLMDFIKSIKLKQKLPIIDKKRDKYIVSSRIELAKKLKIKKRFAKKLVKLIIKNCQKRLKTKK